MKTTNVIRVMVAMLMGLLAGCTTSGPAADKRELGMDVSGERLRLGLGKERTIRLLSLVHPEDGISRLEAIAIARNFWMSKRLGDAVEVEFFGLVGEYWEFRVVHDWLQKETFSINRNTGAITRRAPRWSPRDNYVEFDYKEIWNRNAPEEKP